MQPAFPFRGNWRKRRITAQFQDDPLCNLVMSSHSLTDCSILLENRRLLDLEKLLQDLQVKTRTDLIVYRTIGASLSKRTTTEDDRLFIRSFYDGPLQVLFSFSLALELCLVLLSRQKLVELAEELHHLQKTLRENIADCYRWLREVNGLA